MSVQKPVVAMAWERIHESLNNMLVTFVVPEIKESPVLEVFHHVKTGEERIPDHLTPVAELETEEDEQDV